jgi:hypothetical protein
MHVKLEQREHFQVTAYLQECRPMRPSFFLRVIFSFTLLPCPPMLIFVMNFISMEVVAASDYDQRKHARHTNFVR